MLPRSTLDKPSPSTNLFNKSIPIFTSPLSIFEMTFCVVPIFSANPIWLKPICFLFSYTSVANLTDTLADFECTEKFLFFLASAIGSIWNCVLFIRFIAIWRLFKSTDVYISNYIVFFYFLFCFISIICTWFFKSIQENNFIVKNKIKYSYNCILVFSIFYFDEIMIV